MRVEKENSYMNKEVRKKLSDLKVKKIFWPRYMLANVLIFLDIRFKAGLACTHCSVHLNRFSLLTCTKKEDWAIFVKHPVSHTIASFVLVLFHKIQLIFSSVLLL